MKAYICDQCAAQGKRTGDHYDMPPDGWYTVSRIHLPYHTLSFCSLDCVVTFTTALQQGEAVERREAAVIRG